MATPEEFNIQFDGADETTKWNQLIAACKSDEEPIVWNHGVSVVDPANLDNFADSDGTAPIQGVSATFCGFKFPSGTTDPLRIGVAAPADAEASGTYYVTGLWGGFSVDGSQGEKSLFIGYGSDAHFKDMLATTSKSRVIEINSLQNASFYAVRGFGRVYTEEGSVFSVTNGAANLWIDAWQFTRGSGHNIWIDQDGGPARTRPSKIRFGLGMAEGPSDATYWTSNVLLGDCERVSFRGVALNSGGVPAIAIDPGASGRSAGHYIDNSQIHGGSHFVDVVSDGEAPSEITIGPGMFHNVDTALYRVNGAARIVEEEHNQFSGTRYDPASSVAESDVIVPRRLPYPATSDAQLLALKSSVGDRAAYIRGL